MLALARQRTGISYDVCGATTAATSRASARISSSRNAAIDDPEDLELDYWAGFIPMKTVYGRLQPAPDLRPGIVPGSVPTAV